MHRFIRYSAGFMLIAALILPVAIHAESATDSSTQSLIQALQLQVKALLEQIKQLQGVSVKTQEFCFNFEKDISFGANAESVVALRKALSLAGISTDSEST